MNSFFKVKGKERLMMGLQCGNSSNHDLASLQKSIDAVQKFGGNLIEVPVYWYRIEPEEGKFDLSGVKDLILKVREEGLNLVILWFGSSKNSHPNYMPDWAKLQTNRFRMAIGPNGSPVMMMSPHCRETLEADKRAFVELMKCIREIDSEDNTVVAVQVENEMGIGNSDRDYSDLAQADFAKPVPSDLEGVVLEDSGCGNDGTTWRSRFGRHAAEAFSAWYFARFTEEIAAAGKKEYDIPLLVNVMLGEQGIEEAGVNYNSGSAVGRVLDIWKKGAPSIDLLCPDIYEQRVSMYRRVCDRYARKDNALFIPESATGGPSNAMNIFTAIADYGCIGVCGFGAEHTLLNSGELSPAAEQVAISMSAALSLEPLLIKYRNTNNVIAVVQEEFARSQHIKLDQYHLIVNFLSSNQRRGFGMGFGPSEDNDKYEQRGRVLIVRTGESEFYLAGAGVSIDFTRRPEPDDEEAFSHITSRASTQLNFLTVEEGHFDKDGQWVCDFYRNGDQTNYATYVHPGQTVRVRLNPKFDWLK